MSRSFFRHRLFQGSHIRCGTSYAYDNPDGVAKWLDGEVEMMCLTREGYGCFRSSPDPALQDASLDSHQRRCALFSAYDFCVRMPKIVLFRSTLKLAS